MRQPCSISLQCLGTDCSEAAIKAANAGEYSPHAVQNVPVRWLRNCFEARDRSGKVISHDAVAAAAAAAADGADVTPAAPQVHSYQMKMKRPPDGSTASQAIFGVQDVREEIPDMKFDLISCRYSVFLYLSKEECETALRDIVSCLIPGGFLFIGAQDDLPREWQSLGLREWRGYAGSGIYQLPDGDSSSSGGDGDPRMSVHACLGSFLSEHGSKRLNDEKLGRQKWELYDETKAPSSISDEALLLQQQKFADWEAERERKRVEKEEAELAKEMHGMPSPRFISKEKADAFAERMASFAKKKEKDRAPPPPPRRKRRLKSAAAAAASAARLSALSRPLHGRQCASASALEDEGDCTGAFPYNP